mgnify:CR=1 FL=1
MDLQEREDLRQSPARFALRPGYLDQINRFLNPQQVLVSCPTKITNHDDNRVGALEGEAEVAGFNGDPGNHRTPA